MLPRVIRQKALALVFVGTVAIAYLCSFITHDVSASTAQGRCCILFGTLFAGLGTVSFFHLNGQPGWERFKLGYLVAQMGLIFGVLWTSRLSGEVPICIYPLIGTCVGMYRRVGAAAGVLTVYAMTVFIEYHFYGSDAARHWAFGIIPAFAFVVVFTGLAIQANAARENAVALSAEVENLAVVRERNRLAREIHDSLGHFLTTIHVQLQAAQVIHGVNPTGALEAVGKAQRLAKEALVEVRRSVGALSADGSAGSLAERLRTLAAVTESCGIAVEFDVRGEARPLDTDAEHALYRAAQESLTNVRKHAAARRAQLILEYVNPARVSLEVLDDGRGAERPEGGFGIAGLRKRMSALGGTVIAQNRPQGGFRVRAELPV